MYSTYKIVLLILLYFIPQLINGQTNSEAQFLQKVGVLDSLYSETLNENRHFYIQLPPGYNPNDNDKYPVAFILDGAYLLPTVHNVQSFYSGGFTPEMVLVGISNAKNRTRDLTSSKIEEKYGVPFREENGEAANFRKFIESELIPYVEGKYQVTDFRTLIGHSYGGLFTIYTLLNHSSLFSNYIAIDPSLDWDDQQLLLQAEKTLSEDRFNGKSLFLSLGGQLHMQNPNVTIANVMQDTTDFTIFARSNIAFSNMVKQNNDNGLAFKWQFYPKDLHGTISFPSIMDGLIFNFEWYQMENTDKFNSPTTSKADLYEIVTYRAKKLEHHFKYKVAPYPEDLLNVLGYMSMDMEQNEKAKMFFEFAIEYYPDSPNVYDSMAAYYERNNDNTNALKFATKAYELSGEAYHLQRIKEINSK